VTIGGLHTTDSSASALDHGEQRTAAQSITGNELPSHRGISPPPKAMDTTRKLNSPSRTGKRGRTRGPNEDRPWRPFLSHPTSLCSVMASSFTWQATHTSPNGQGRVRLDLYMYLGEPVGRGVVHIADADHAAEDFGLRFRWKGYEERWKI
jgi:hypothetical protein